VALELALAVVMLGGGAAIFSDHENELVCAISPHGVPSALVIFIVVGIPVGKRVRSTGGSNATEPPFESTHTSSACRVRKLPLMVVGSAAPHLAPMSSWNSDTQLVPSGFCSQAQRSSGDGSPEHPYTAAVAAKGSTHATKRERKRMG
jgi:hypothetical protein